MSGGRWGLFEEIRRVLWTVDECTLRKGEKGKDNRSDLASGREMSQCCAAAWMRAVGGLARSTGVVPRRRRRVVEANP